MKRAGWLLLAIWVLASIWPPSRAVVTEDALWEWRKLRSLFRAGERVDRSAEFAARFPDDRLTWFWKTRDAQFSRNSQIRWKDVAARFPGDVRFGAFLLRNSINDAPLPRKPGPRSDPDWGRYPKIVALPPAPFPAPASPSSEPEEAQVLAENRRDYEEMLGMARQFGALDPQNAYFDVLAAYALFGLKRDEEAQIVLKRASRKTIWRAYYFAEVEDAMRARRLLGENVGWGERLNSHYATTLPELARLRNIARISLDLAQNEARFGKEKSLLDACETWLRLGHLQRTQDEFQVGASVGMALQTLSFQARALGLDAPPPRFSALTLAQAQRDGRTVWALAKKHQRADLFALASREWRAIRADRAGFERVRKSWAFLTFSREQSWQLSGIFVAETMRRFCLICALFFTLGALFFGRLHPGLPTFWNLKTGVFALLSLAGTGAALLIHWQSLAQISGGCVSGPVFHPAAFFAGTTFLFSELAISSPIFAGWLLAFLLAIPLFSAVKASSPMRKRTPREVPRLREIFSPSAYFRPSHNLLPGGFGLDPLFNFLVFWAPPLLWFVLPILGVLGLLWWSLQSVWGAILLPFYLFGWAATRWFCGTREGSLLVHFLPRVRGLWWSVAALATLFYLMLLPVADARKDAEARQIAEMRRGEAATMRQNPFFIGVKKS